MTREVIARIIAARPKDRDEADWIASELERMSAIKARFALQKRELDVVIQRHMKEMKELGPKLREEEARLQSECPHYDVSRYTGPNRGDSYDQCETCGKEI